jgi:arylformamidase
VSAGASRSELTGHEREYSPSTCIPSIDVELERYRRASSAAASLVTHTLSSDAGGAERVLAAEAFPGAPLHVFVHGGYWQALGAVDSLLPAPELVAGGRSFAAVDYTLAPEVTIGAMIDECVRALELVVRTLRPSAVTLSGSSAGAHLAAHVALRTSVRVDRLILLSGMFQLQPLLGTYIAEPLALDELTAAAWSVPLDRTPAAQLFVLHGEHETAAFKAQSARLAARWGAPVVEVCDRNHFDLLHDLAAIDLRPGVPAPLRLRPLQLHHALAGEEPGPNPPNPPNEDAEAAEAAERPGAPRRLSRELLHPDAAAGAASSASEPAGSAGSAAGSAGSSHASVPRAVTPRDATQPGADGSVGG